MSAPISPVAFCANFLMTCTNVAGFTIPAGYSTFDQCQASYSSSTKQACQSYHLCANAFMKTTPDRRVHCPHAAAMGPCSP
jgi:hypothetical protein